MAESLSAAVTAGLVKLLKAFLPLSQTFYITPAP